MNDVTLRQLTVEDESAFLEAMRRSQALHHPWVKPPTNSAEFQGYFAKYQKANNRCYLMFEHDGHLAGVFNINEIVLGVFQSAYLGYFSVSGYDGKSYMSRGLKLLLQEVFIELSLHRLEANIQPNNLRSIYLVKNNGFSLEGYSPRYLKVAGEWRDHERWAITYEDWCDKESLLTD